MEQVDEVWVIKDSQGHFAHRESIRGSALTGWEYVSYQVYTPECRSYRVKMLAEEAIKTLNKKPRVTDFCLELHSIDDLIKDARQFVGNPMVIVEYSDSAHKKTVNF